MLYGRFVCVVLFLVQPILAQDQCNDVLKAQLSSTLNVAASADLASTLQDWMCSQQGGNTRNSIDSGVSIGLPIPGVPIQFGGSLRGEDASSWFTNVCRLHSAHLTTSQAQSIVEKITPAKTIVDAWKACLLIKYGTPTASRVVFLEKDDPQNYADTFNVIIEWRPTADRPNPPVVKGNLIVSGAICPAAPKDGETIAVPQIVQCKRLGSAPSASIALNTDQGSSGTLTVPFAPPPPPLAPLPVDGNIYALVPRASGNGKGGLVLEVKGCKDADGSPVDIWGNGGFTNQHWYLVKDGGVDQYQLKDVQNENKCLESAPAGSPVQIGPCQVDAIRVHWSIRSTVTADANHSYYTISSAEGLLTVAEGLPGLAKYGTYVEVQAPVEDSFNQEWEFLPADIGTQGCK